MPHSRKCTQATRGSNFRTGVIEGFQRRSDTITLWTDIDL